MKIGRTVRGLCAAAALASAPAFAQPVVVKDAWVRAPADGQPVAAAYMELTSRSSTVLLSVASPVAGRAELHGTMMENGVMKMRGLDLVELPGGRTVRFAPGGLHVMLLDLKRPLKPGDKVPLTLRVQLENAVRSTFAVQAEVRADEPVMAHHHP